MGVMNAGSSGGEAPTTAPEPGASFSHKGKGASAVAAPRVQNAHPTGAEVQAAVFPGAWQAPTLAGAGVPVRL
jgi:hypothetical protein